jgi:glucose/arabinose dehydrogenase
MRATQGVFYGWPWFYIGDHENPIYAGQHPESASKFLVPDVLFHPHSAPLGFVVYTGAQFPPEYHGELFVAFHGSWNRANSAGSVQLRCQLFLKPLIGNSTIKLKK